MLSDEADDIVHERHVFPCEECAMVTVWDLLVMEGCWDSVAGPAAVDCVCERVLLAYEHGDGHVLQGRDIDHWRLL
jgi:hypothetical protein